jgi:hypothetical protein
VNLAQGSLIAAPQEICAMVWLWHETDMAAVFSDVRS